MKRKIIRKIKRVSTEFICYAIVGALFLCAAMILKVAANQIAEARQAARGVDIENVFIVDQYGQTIDVVPVERGKNES